MTIMSLGLRNGLDKKSKEIVSRMAKVSFNGDKIHPSHVIDRICVTKSPLTNPQIQGNSI